MNAYHQRFLVGRLLGGSIDIALLTRLAALTVASLGASVQWASAASLVVANPSFEAPIFADTGFGVVGLVAQGGYGWVVSDASGFYNPPVQDYFDAGGNGTPQGGAGAQVGYVFGFGDYTISQRLAGADGVPGNDDDPVYQPNTVYTLTAAVGQRAAGNIYGVTYGGYELRLIAGVGAEAVVVGNEADSSTPPPGTFIDRTLVLDSSMAPQGSYGKPLTILLRKTIQNATADTDFDNIRIDAVSTPPPGDFNLDLYVDGRDFLIWQRGFGIAIGAQRLDGDANLDGDVDGDDFRIWRERFPFGLGSSGAPVPEPTSAIIAVAASTAFFRAFQWSSGCVGRRRYLRTSKHQSVPVS